MYHKPKVSLIIPVYNGEKHLPKAIDSAMNQSLEEIEIIVVNDGSTDKTSILLEQYKMRDNRIHVYSHAKNTGLGPSRNLGVKHARGEYLYFLDADDYLHPNALETLYEQAKSEDLDILQSKYIRKEKNTKKILPEDLSPLSAPVKGIEYFHQSFFIPPTVWAKLYRTDFLKQNRIEFKNQINEDMPFAFEAVFKAKRISNNLMPTYIYQINENSISSKFGNRHIEDYIKVLDELQAYFIYPELTDERSVFPVQYYLFMARLSDRVIKYGNTEQKKKVKNFVEKRAKKFKHFLVKNQTYPFLKRMILKSSPYHYSLLSQTFRKEKHIN